MATKRQVLEALATMNFADITMGDITVTAEDIKETLEKSIAQIDNRNAKAAERQAQKKAAGDELRATIKATLSDSPMTVSDIVKTIDDPEVTSAMVVARLGQLVKLGEINKAETKVDGRTLKIYTLA
jgi:predicted  nucleic acid-binding Zn-ribbon protein